MPALFFENALLPDGWAEDVTLEIDHEGWIRALRPDSPKPAAGASGG